MKKKAKAKVNWKKRYLSLLGSYKNLREDYFDLLHNPNGNFNVQQFPMGYRHPR